MPRSAVATQKLDNFIHEVFIDPIRSVLFVDDEFPTLDGVLEDYFEAEERKKWHTRIAEHNIRRLQNLVEYCRSDEREWLVDVHDGSNISVKDEPVVVERLRQSDLLVLDYNLDGDHKDSTKCVAILRSLAESDHFNLAVVYSKVPKANVFVDVAISLIGSWDKLEELDAKVSETIDDIVFDVVAEEPDIEEMIAESLSKGSYLQLRQYNTLDMSDERVAPILSPYVQLLENELSGKELDEREFILWAIRDAEKRWGIQGTQISEHSYSEGAPNWMRVGNLFVTVARKRMPSDEDESNGVEGGAAPAEELDDASADTLEAADVFGGLEEALIAWKPAPNRLIFSKMKSEVEVQGLRLDDQALSDNRMQALWLMDLVRAEGSERDATIAASVRRYGETLVSTVTTRAVDYANRIISVESGRATPAGLAKEYFGTNLATAADKQDACLSHNRHVCSMPPQGWHLTTGHVFLLEEEYWVCLSPACDLVPREKGKGRGKSLHPFMPIKAVKLRKMDSKKKAVKEANSNLIVYLDVKGDGETECFHFLPGNSSQMSPEWEEFYCYKGGCFESHEMDFQLFSARSEEQFGAWSLSLQPGKARVAAQLRYEYALNLLHRLGANVTRIGLDFQNP